VRIRSCAFLIGLTLISLLNGAETVRLDGTSREVTAGHDDTSYVVTPQGGALTAPLPVTCTGAITLERAGADGLTATVIATSLRGTTTDDWRLRADIAGTRLDPAINLPTPAGGTPAERQRFHVSGHDGDWDAFSIQWDGVITIPSSGIEMATASDDGSRVWIDLNHDGTVQANEWGSNGWGGGQGTTQRVVHRSLPAGRFAIRVQFEDGGGPNSCRLLWRTHGDQRDWQVVPDEAFRPFARLTVDGPVTLAGAISGGGYLDCGPGVALASRPEVAALTLRGRVSLAKDLDLRGINVQFSLNSRLDCAGHRLQLDQLSGTGIIALSGGRLVLPAAELALHLSGPGTLEAANGITVLQSCDESVTITGDQYTVRDGTRCRAQLALSAPLTTVFTLGDQLPGNRAMNIDVVIPPGAPADLGLGVWRADPVGRWFQRVHNGALPPGAHHLHLNLSGDQILGSEGHRGRWNASAAVDSGKIGLFCFASAPGTGLMTISTTLIDQPPAHALATTLTDFDCDGWDGKVAHATTGERWQLHVRPVPYPVDPYDPAIFCLDLEVTEPDGSKRQFAGFHHQGIQRHDDGNRETFTAIGTPTFSIRFRPRVAGLHRLRLLCHDATGDRSIALADLHVSGNSGDGIARIDREDPRFFSADGRFVWPLGHNLHSTYDTRSVGCLNTKLTVDRGSFVREAFLERLVANGGTGCETWLSAWNLGLEWIPKWPGYHGPGRYHEGHAWAFDHFLDLAERLGVKVNVSIFNHGMARDGAGAEMEWPFHPYNVVNGGWLTGPEGLFTDARAFAMQRRLFRYLTARYSDSPALLGWKLWAEVNLAHAPNAAVVDWHSRASAVLGAADPYGRAVTSHWCGDWNSADRAICAQPTITYITIDAYHGTETALPGLLCQSVRDPLAPGLGLGTFGKPVIVTEFGGSPGACAPARLEAEHGCGPWVGLVSGHAASPMLWWVEWIDQGDRYGVYRAVSRFIAGEDLRGRDAACVAPTLAAKGTSMWCRAWRNGEQWLGYAIDPAWSVSGGEGRLWSDATLTLDGEVPAGDFTIAWWDAEIGAVLSTARITHAGGRPTFAVPNCQRHIAFKIRRTQP